MLLPISIILLFSSLLFFYSFKLKKHTHANKRQGFTTYPLLGCAPEFLANRHRILECTTDVLSPLPTQTAVFYRPAGGAHGVITANPANVEHVLRACFDNYPKGPRFVSILRDFLGHGIFNSDGELWLLQRKTASFEFNKRSLKNFLLDAVKTEIKARLGPLLWEAARSGRVVDLQDVLERFAFDNVCKLAFNVDPGCLGAGPGHDDGFMRAFDEATTLSCGRFMYMVPALWRAQRLLGLGPEARLREAVRKVHGFADRIIRLRLEERERNGEIDGYQDLLSRFIDKEETSVELLRDVVISVILAGKDTTSTGLSWLFWLLSTRPGAVERIRAEVAGARARAGRRAGEVFEYEELREMHYLHAAISESLRLYPPVPVDTKACLEDDVLPDGTRVRGGMFVLYNAYAMGRAEGVWGEGCREFRPERWLDAGGSYRPESPFKFPAFNAGPRTCLGKEMAYVQMKSIVAHVVEGFEVEVLGKERRPEYVLSLTLRMKGGLPVRIKERS